MDSEAWAAKASGSAKAPLDDGLSQRNVHNQSPSSSPTQPRSSSSPNRSPPSAKTPPSPSSTSKRLNRDDITTDKVIIADRSYTMFVLLFILGMIPIIILALVMMGVPFMGLLLGGVSLCVYAVVRNWYMKWGYKLPIPSRFANAGRTRTGNLLDGVPAAFFLYVLGSGGHTAEMFELIRKSANPACNVHRRYIYTLGDNNSLNAIINFETRVQQLFGHNGGTWDAYQVVRARNIHQPIYTAWFTSLLSILSIYDALTTTPRERRHSPEERRIFKHPHVITTNGPASGVMTALVARLLKIFSIAPQNSLKVVFIETWAHVSTLSFTGKIFHWARYFGGITDVFVVQHHEVADKYGYRVFDFIIPVPRRPANTHG
ncbi:Alg14-domain-containing protein [Coniochaeta ligniaria NRRL 30616]|uniref:UDP-N-acetylglucosamine transferase subunit ALG14 n=1 Tax=Coniochaeta ligniaria NRRL 30616 TaxID=1408157 RepID=A0A1J7JBK9_9PEZI|nr:Alg14-domain-containing protein [Coniochaeta ligniaria NRRL 30616]